MSTLTSQQTFKVLCSHLRHPLRHLPHRPHRPLRPFSSSHVGSLQAPSSGYDTLARRSSSYPSPLKLSTLGSRQHGTDSSGYVDIHDFQSISGLEMYNYDVLITDLNEAALRTDVSKFFGIDYLAKVTEDDAKRKIGVVNGFLYGEGRRAMVPFVVSRGDHAYWVHFIVDTGVPFTFLSEKVSVLPMQRVYSAVNLIPGVPHSRPQSRNQYSCYHLWKSTSNPNVATELALCGR